MPRCSAIGFDLGETLLTYAEAPLNWVTLYRPALMKVASALETVVTETQINAAESVLASYNTRLHPRIQEVTSEEIFSQALRTWPVNSVQAREGAIEAFFGFFQQSLRAYDDTLSVLHLLRSRGVSIGILTDVPYGMPREFVRRDLAVTGVAPLIDVLLTSVEVGFRKPAPAGFHRLASALEVDATEMIYVGNEPKDIAGANAAGMASVLIDREKKGARLGQTETVHSLLTILELLAQARAEQAVESRPRMSARRGEHNKAGGIVPPHVRGGFGVARRGRERLSLNYHYDQRARRSTPTD